MRSYLEDTKDFIGNMSDTEPDYDAGRRNGSFFIQTGNGTLKVSVYDEENDTWNTIVGEA